MQILDFSQNNINIVFEVTEDKKVVLKNFSNKEYEPIDLKWCEISDVHISGGNQNDHHGSKHTGSSGIFSLTYSSHNYYENEYGNKLEFNLSDGNMEVVAHYQFYKEISAIRCWTTVTNISDSNIGLEYVSSFAFTGIDFGLGVDADEKMNIYIPHNSWKREFMWRKNTLSDFGFDKTNSFSVKRVNIANTGSWSAKEYLPTGAIENTETKTAFMWQIENNGSWQWEVGDIANKMYLKLSGPTEHENQWHKELEPGESFESVKVSVCIGTDFTSALEAMTMYRRKIVRENIADKKLPVIFNDYMNCLWADPTTEKVIPVVDKAAEAGAEYYCMDAGWYADGTWWETVGEWQPCKWRFPNGIKEVFDYIRSKNMIPGIWLEIEVMGINSPILDEFDDSCFFIRHGRRVIDHGRYQLDFRSEKVRDFATSVIDRLVNEYGVGYIKMDYNIDAGAGTELDSDSFGDGLLEHNRAYLKWIEGIMDKYSELVIESCASGSMRMDYAILGLHPIFSVSDEEDYRNMAVIAANCATGILPEQGAIWSYPKADGDKYEAEFNMVNAMLTRMHLSGEILNLSEKQLADVKEGVSLYKSIRKNIPDFIPFYPLGLNRNKADFACVGYKHKNGKYIALWRLGGDVDSVEIPGVKNAKIMYPSDSVCEIKECEGGLCIKMSEKYCAVIIECE